MKSFATSILLLFVFTSGLTSVFGQTVHRQDDHMMKKTGPTVIRISQTDGKYTTHSLDLVPGDYIFEVTNLDVDQDLGFYLQDADDKQVKSSGLKKLVGKGETSRSGVVTLTEGSFKYSCPINPTPHYTLNVAAPRVVKLDQVEGEYATTELNLTAGHYIFEVTNLEVDKDLGFYLQDQATEAQIENSGLESLIGNGETSRTGVVYLAAGEYQYSCPLNPTPHYTLSVR